MKIKNDTIAILAVFSGLMLFSLESRANAGWPALMVIVGAAQAIVRFWFLVAASLLIEGYLLWKLSGLKAWKASLAVIVANLFSTVVGYFLSIGMALSDGWFFALDTEGPHIIVIDLVLIFMVSVFVETLVARLFWRAPLKRILPVMSVSNFVTHALNLVLIFTLPLV